MIVSSDRRSLAVLVVAALVVSSCGTVGNSDASDTSHAPASALVAAVASYDLVAGRSQRFLVGLFASDSSGVSAYGTVTFSFGFLGAGDDAVTATEPEAGQVVTASFLPVPGQDVDLSTAGPQLVSGSEATGVYGAPDVEFDRPGVWEVAVEANIDGRTERTTAAFEVLASSDIPAPGDVAPHTRQPLAGDPGVNPKAIDSRAGSDRTIPDPELHDVTVAAAIAAGLPAMVVVSTPTFCVSRFCGPITDTVHELALQYGNQMAFIHIEVWQDFVGNTVNPAAAQWIIPTPETAGREPWVFVIDANSVIRQRFDNVATDAELRTAVETAIGD